MYKSVVTSPLFWFTFDAGHILKAGLDPGLWTLDSGLWTLDSGLFPLKTLSPPEKTSLSPPKKLPPQKEKFLPPNKNFN